MGWYPDDWSAFDDALPMPMFADDVRSAFKCCCCCTLPPLTEPMTMVAFVAPAAAAAATTPDNGFRCEPPPRIIGNLCADDGPAAVVFSLMLLAGSDTKTGRTWPLAVAGAAVAVVLVPSALTIWMAFLAFCSNAGDCDGRAFITWTRVAAVAAAACMMDIGRIVGMFFVVLGNWACRFCCFSLRVVAVEALAVAPLSGWASCGKWASCGCGALQYSLDTETAVSSSTSSLLKRMHTRNRLLTK